MQLLLFFYTLVGLVVGSFLNVCIHRLPRKESIVFPGSHCPLCDNAIKPYDNIPVLSYLLLRGKCRSCKRSISFQYPLVELLSGLAFCSCGLEWNFAPATFINSLFLSVVIVLVFIDYHHKILPNVLTLPGTVIGILLSPLQSGVYYDDIATLNLASLLPFEDVQFPLPWVGSILGAVIGAGVLYLVAFAYELTRKKQGLGMGDVKMMAMVGAFLGWQLALLTIFAGSFLGSLCGIFLMLFHGKNLQFKIAFGTFLGAGAALSLFFGLSFIHWYLNTF